MKELLLNPYFWSMLLSARGCSKGELRQDLVEAVIFTKKSKYKTSKRIRRTTRTKANHCDPNEKEPRTTTTEGYKYTG